MGNSPRQRINCFAWLSPARRAVIFRGVRAKPFYNQSGMKWLLACLLVLITTPLRVRALTDATMSPAALASERLGTVAFATSCAPSVQAPFDRAIALLHDFWYEEAEKQFEEISKADPSCAIAHWGIAMSQFHQIWNRPDEKVMAHGWAELQEAHSPAAKTEREREYISALSGFYEPGKQEYQARVEAYSAAMAKLYSHYPDDIGAGAFYALSLLGAESPTDTSLANERKALAVLNPLFERNSDHPGLAHYIIHACHTPSLAPQGLAAAQRYGEIAPSAPHAAHMPGHIFARLGMWREDIAANLASAAASESAEATHQSGAFDQLHADDFLLYAYLQSGQDGNAKGIVDKTAVLLTRFEAMPHMSTHGMDGMFAAYRGEFPAIYFLEMRDWKSGAALEPAAGALPEAQLITYWARTIAAARLREPLAARAGVAKYDTLAEEVKKGKRAYMADSTFAKITRGEMLAWAAFAEGKPEHALKEMRESAELQDKVGQGEVDIPAREMLADMLLESGQPQQALIEYEVALKMSPNRFNGLFNAGMAAEAAGDKARAAKYYAALLKTTDNGSQSMRPEIAHVKSFVSSTQLASQ
jgi:tetratricopeptide (TPR) repeat protein